MSTYLCPKCYNILPISNKILHDLKCTKERPVAFSQENPYTSSMDYNNDIFTPLDEAKLSFEEDDFNMKIYNENKKMQKETVLVQDTIKEIVI